MKHFRLYFPFILLFFTILSCREQNIKFDKDKWDVKEDFLYVNREKMVSDLIENRLKKGMKYKEVIELLGNSDKISNYQTLELHYEISIEYGWNIDPINGKNLKIEFTKDSIIKAFRIYDWGTE